MTAWLAPSVLAASAAEVVLSGLFANYADKRESEAGLSDATWRYPAAPDGSFWLDYASDVGDGFDSSYLIARLLAEPKLTVDDEETERGRVLVLGGDQVYPSASWQGYAERFTGPYTAALQPIPEPGQRPDLFAVPGNHDWYDGLTAFMRVFCQGRGIGGWQTQQRRSYFALRLPHKWWLWGIDIQFDVYIDEPQLAYFSRVAELATQDHRIILATAKPSWVGVRDPAEPPQSWQSLAYFQERVMCVHGAELALTITGDLHHYSRYEPSTSEGTPKITAGGGGAYLSPTHWLPEHRELPNVPRDQTTPYDLAERWPSEARSRALRHGVLWHLLPWRTPTLAGVLASIYGLLALLLAVGVKDQERSIDAGLGDPSAGALLGDALTLWSVALAALLLWGLTAWARSGDAPRAWGALHAVVQLGAATAIALALLAWDPLGWGATGFWWGYAAAALAGFAGVLAGRVILTLYLWTSQLLHRRWHANEVFAAQAREAGTGFKHFLRLRIDKDGLTVYAIGAERVPREWTSEARPEPEDGWPALTLVDRRDFPTPGS